MALLLEEGVGMSLHAAREESDMFLMADMLSCSPTTCAGVFLISGFLILSLLVVGEEPEVSLMIVPDDDEAAVHVGGGATGEADVPVGNEAAGEELTKVIVGGIELAGVTAGFENEANDTFEAAVADGELTEDIVGGVGTSGGHSGGRSCDEMTSTACWEPRSESGACLGSRPTLGESLESAKVVVAALVVAVVTGVVVAAVEVVFSLTPPKLRKSSTENFNAVGK